MKVTRRNGECSEILVSNPVKSNYIIYKHALFHSAVVKEGTPENDVLQKLAKEVVEEWKELGRRLLRSDEAKLYTIHKENEKWFEKAYDMLLKWKQANGSRATFQVLHDALCNVERRDLAEEFCLEKHG